MWMLKHTYTCIMLCTLGLIGQHKLLAHYQNYAQWLCVLAGKYKVHDDGKMQWPAGRWGMCGDPYDAPVKRLEQVENITGKLYSWTPAVSC